MALHWEKLHAIYKDSIILSESSIDMLTAEHKHQLRQNEQQYKSGINYYNYLIGCVVLVLLVWVLIWRRKRKNFQKRMRALQTEKDRIEKEKLEQLRDIENQLHAKKQEVKVAYGAVQEDRKKTAVLHAELEKLCTHRQEMFMSYMRESKEYKYLMDFIRKVQEQDMPLTFEENQWRSLVKVIDKFSIGFTEHLLAKYPALNPEDVRFCCLLKLELPYPDIAAVCARTPSAIYKRRTNILEKMKPAEEDASLRSIVRKI